MRSTSSFRAGLLMAALSSANPAAGAESRPRDKVFVPPVQGRGLERPVLEALFDLVVVTVSRADVVDVVTAQDVQEQLAQEKRKDALGCNSVSCATELAGALGVRYLLATRVRRLGANLIVTASLIDTVEQHSKSGQGECPDEAARYRQAVEAAVTEALGVTKHALALHDGGAAAPARAAEAVYVSAAFNRGNGKAYFFTSDGRYVRYDLAADRADSGYPRAVTDASWRGLEPYARQLVGAGRAAGGNAVYFFLAGGRYLRYDLAADRVDEGYPRAVDDRSWPGLGPFAAQIAGVMDWKGGKLQFFLKDGRWARYDLAADRVDDGTPGPVDDASWPGLAPFARGLAGLVDWGNGKAYLFLRDGRYLRYDVEKGVDAGYPAPVSDENWPGLGRAVARE